MSLLLEALKKSEDERTNRRAGEPVYAGNAAAGGSRSALPWLAALVFGGIAAGLAAWVFLGKQGPSAIPATSSSTADVAVVSPKPDSITAKTEPASAQASPAIAAPPMIVATPPVLVDQPMQAATPSPALPDRSLYGAAATPPKPTAKSTDSTADTAITTPSAKIAKPIKPAASAPPNPALKQDTTTSIKGVADKESRATASAPTSIAKPASPLSPTNEIIALGDLPADIRAELPALRPSGYMHADDTNDRLIAINDKLVRVGDEAAPGVRVQAISATSVVFAYKGYRFRIAQ
jgi:general secretion pathway protein B